jgi:O-antigen/teichoic acid export membrane protein
VLHLALPERVGWLAILVAAWAGMRAIIDCVRSGLLASQDYERVALVMAASAATGLAALAIMTATGPFTLERLMVAHVAGLGVGALAAVVVALPLAEAGVRPPRGGLGALLRYARWPALAEGTRLLQLNAGAFLVVSLAGTEEAGLFGIARYPALVFDVVALTLYQYWLSSSVRRSPAEGLRPLLAMQMRMAVAVSGLAVLAAVAAKPFLGVLGESFAVAAPLFVLNAVDYAMLMLVRPAESAYHGLHAPWLEWVQRCAVLPLLLAAGWLLVPRYGAAGMVWAHITAGAASLCVALLLLRGRLDIPLSPEEAAT